MPRRLQPRAETPYDLAVDEARRQKIREVWTETAIDGLGSLMATAEALGISRSTLYREIERLGLELK
jgi:transcriptional regulator of acetoin/glycerol metabolism